jgi:hypothetical protein
MNIIEDDEIFEMVTDSAADSRADEVIHYMNSEGGDKLRLEVYYVDLHDGNTYTLLIPEYQDHINSWEPILLEGMNSREEIKEFFQEIYDEAFSQ